MSGNPFSLAGKTALVTGATGYFGQSIAQSLMEAGAEVYLNGRNAAAVEALVATFQERKMAARPAIFDILSEEETANFFDVLGSAPLDILVNNAYAGATGAIEVADAQNYRDSYEITVVVAHRLLRGALENLRVAKHVNGDASVINIASMYGVVSPDLRVYQGKPDANGSFYGAAKAALIQWTRYGACEFGPEGIRFNVLTPGAFPSPAAQGRYPQLIAQLEKKVPLGRIGVAHEIGGVVAFLSSPAASYVNGATIAVDGGWTAW
ncbi:SDR family NAD(P)-dependent oxidoreductase [Stappia sp. P2PMeth1]|uniref:SDR family NAD(P)-dependent oxidoreductase n=1 Tax=Stappia sp. P2PMeth1 TaxID=2003586 RepID=UPI001647D030|nr:SDR family oxidoreductase [Stappia sp. P2PMeth1]